MQYACVDVAELINIRAFHKCFTHKSVTSPAIS